jgi:hypothetical protein
MGGRGSTFEVPDGESHDGMESSTMEVEQELR